MYSVVLYRAVMARKSAEPHSPQASVPGSWTGSAADRRASRKVEAPGGRGNVTPEED